MKPADVLSPAEASVAEGRFGGRPPLGRALAVAVLALGIHLAYTGERYTTSVHELANTEVYWGPLHVTVLGWEGDLDGAGDPTKGGWGLDGLREWARRGVPSRSLSGSQMTGSVATRTFTRPILLPTWLVPLLAVLELARAWWWRRRRWVATAARVVGIDGAGRWVGSLPIASPTDAAARADELLRRRVPLFGAPADVEDVLAPGERLVWDGRPHGLAPWWSLRLAGAVVFLIIYCTVAALDIDAMSRSKNLGKSWNPGTPSSEETEWKLSWLEIGSSHTTTYALAGSKGATSASTQTAYWTSPVVFLPFFAAAELLVLTWFRSRRYAVTHDRVFALGWRGRWLGSLSRAQPLEAKVSGSSVTIRGAAGRLRFSGLEDPHAVASAFDATGPVPPAPAPAAPDPAAPPPSV